MARDGRARPDRARGRLGLGRSRRRSASRRAPSRAWRTSAAPGWRPFAPPRSTSPRASTSWFSRSGPRRCATSRAGAASSPARPTSRIRPSRRGGRRRGSSRCSRTAYMDHWGVTRETLARVAVKNHEHATRNPKAHFRTPITVEDVLARPSGRGAVRHAGLHADDGRRRRGRARLGRVGPGERRALRRHPRLRARRHAGLLHDLLRRDERLPRLPGDAGGGGGRLSRRPGSPDPRGQLDLVECHDCFTVTELVNTEDLGLCGRGEGGALLESGATTLRRRHPGQRLGRAAVVRASGRRDRRADDRRDRRPHPRARGGAAGRGSAPRRRAHPRWPRRGVDRSASWRAAEGARSRQRLQRLEDERAILDRLYAYGHSLDYGVARRVAGLLDGGRRACVAARDLHRA